MLETGLKSTVLKQRQVCPGKGCRAIYQDVNEKLPVGRDKFEALMRELGLLVKKPKTYLRTTQAGQRVFDNLLIEKQVNHINQVWQADMTYYKTPQGKNLYIMLITDVYSQRIIGYGAYERAFADNFNTVLKGAIRRRQKEGAVIQNLIHHSDGGKQYEATIYQKTCAKHGIQQSMCYYSWENPYAEKSNDLIKNRYLHFWKPKNLGELRQMLKRAVIHHNQCQRKTTLNNLSPRDFEETLTTAEILSYDYLLKLKPSKPRTRNNSNIFVENLES